MISAAQVVPTSMCAEELCVNGMSFSRRQSRWANSALVVGTTPSQWAHHSAQHGVLAGVQLQVEAERCDCAELHPARPALRNMQRHVRCRVKCVSCAAHSSWVTRFSR